MKQFSKQFHTRSQSVQLKTSERDALRERIVSYMEYHPLEGKVHSATPLKSPFYGTTERTIRIPTALILKWSAATAVFIFVSIPVMAEQAVPGDGLYAVKIKFNEEVISTLKLSPYEKVEWETERLNRRIAEAQLLASEGRLTDEVETEIADAVKQHADDAAKEIEELRKTDADSATIASIELGSTLQLQSSSLRGDVPGQDLALVDVIPETAEKLLEVIDESLSQNEQQGETSTIPAFDKITARVEINTTRAYELLSSLELSAEDQVYKDISRRLEDVGRSIERANTLRSENEDVAREELVGVLQRTQKLIVFMSGPLVTTTDIETVVPIQYTADEFRDQLRALTEDVNRKSEILTILLPQASAETAEKVQYALDVAATNEGIITTSEDPSNAVTLAKESITVLSDALKILENEGVTPQLIPPVAEEESESETPEEQAPEAEATTTESVQ